MRILQLSFVYACIAIGGQAYSGVQDPVSAPKYPAWIVAQDPATFDPFAASGTREAVAEREHAQTKPASRVTGMLDLLYQGTYLPDPIHVLGKDSQHNLYLDATGDWAATDNATLGARVLAHYEMRELGVDEHHRGEVVPLEYFYRQQFADKTQALTVGRKVLGWSSGFQWRPADLIDNGFSTKNISIEAPDRYRGVNQVRYELIRPEFELTAAASNHKRLFFDGGQFAAKLSLKRALNVSLLYAINGAYSRKYGVIADTSLPWDSTIALEAVHVDIDRNMMMNPSRLGRTLESLSNIHRYEDVYLSLTKFIDDKQRVNIEYFHNGRGLGDASGNRGSVTAIPAATVVVDPSIFSQQYVGRNYVYAAYTGYFDKWKLQFKPSVLVNTGDNSYIGAISIKRELGGDSELSLILNTFHGADGTEFSSVTHGVGIGISFVLHLF